MVLTATRKYTFEDKVCAVEGCGAVFSPTSGRSKYCSSCSEAKKREKRKKRQQQRYYQITGKICKWCNTPDSDVAFKTETECNNCYAASQRNGRCTACEGKPLEKDPSRDMPSCPDCGLPGAGEQFVAVLMFCDGEVQTVFRLQSAVLYCGNERLTLKELQELCQGHVEMVVEEAAFRRKWIARPVTVRLKQGWINPQHFSSWSAVRALSQMPTWGKGMRIKLKTSEERAVNTDLVYQLYDILHFIRLDEANPMTYEWWRDKFRDVNSVSEDAHLRHWERFKSRLRTLGIPFQMVDIDTGEVALSGWSSHRLGIQFQVRALGRFVKEHLPPLEATA